MGDTTGTDYPRSDDSRVTALLILCNGEGVPQRIELSGKTKTFGRAVTNDVVCNCLQISRKHAAFEYSNNKWFLKDMSTNGLSVNNQKISKGIFAELSHNDVIMFIPTGTLQYRIEYVDFPVLPGPSISIASAANNVDQSQSRRAISDTNDQGGVQRSVVKNERILELNSDDSSNHSESLLVEGDFLGFPVESQSQAQSSSTRSNEDKPSTLSTQNSLNKNATADNRSKRPHSATLPENGELESTAAKKKYFDNFFLEILKNDDEVEQVLPDIEDRVESVEEVQELPDIDGPFICDEKIYPRKGKKLQCAADIMSCNDIHLLRSQYLECLEKLKNKEITTEVQLMEKNIEYQKILDKCCEAESKAEVHKEEIFKLVMDTMEREFGCCVCNEIFIQATVIECGHTFCNFCITEWIRRNPECPICRTPVKKQTKHNEMENFIVTIHTLMSDEIRTKREQTLQERTKAIEKAEIDRQASARGRRGAIAEFPDRNIIEFLTDIHMNQMFGVREVARGRRAGTRGAASNRRSTRLQNQVGDVVAAVAMGGHPVRGRSTRGRSRRGASAPRIPAETIPNPLNVMNAPSAPIPITGGGVSSIDQQPGPSRFMGLLGMVSRAAASTSRVAGINFFTTVPNQSAIVGSSSSAGIPNNNIPSTSASTAGGAAPANSDSVVLLSSDDDLELIDEALRGRRNPRVRTSPINIDFFANTSDSSDDEY